MPRPRVSRHDHGPATKKWIIQVGHTLHCKRADGMTLGVAVVTGAHSEEWAVMAIETPTLSIKQTKTTVDGMNAVFENHSHKVIGTYSLGKAMEVADKYADKWLARKTKNAPCVCDDIDAGPDLGPELDIDGIAHSVLGKMTPAERSAFARGELPKTSKKPRGRVGSALKGARDVRQSKAAADHP